MKIPRYDSVAYALGMAINLHGPLSYDDLMAKSDSSIHLLKKRVGFSWAIKAGWLIEDGGLIGLCHDGRVYFHRMAEAIGSSSPVIVPARTASAWRPLQAKHIPSGRGNRSDIPEHSVRETPNFKTLGGIRTAEKGTG